MDSQVVAAVRSEIDYYEQLFMPNPEPKPFPYRVKHPAFDLFAWERRVNGYYVWESDLETEEEIGEARAKAVETKEYMIGGKMEKSHFISTGDLWVGSTKERWDGSGIRL